MKKYKGRIVDVYLGRGGFRRIIQGIKKDKQPSYDSNFYGSNGTYIASDETYPTIYVKVSVYDFDKKAIEIDIREIVMTQNKWERMTEKRLLDLKSKLTGIKVTIFESEEDYYIENIQIML
jgi:hypothetical protein